jgi:hypothetical protein
MSASVLSKWLEACWCSQDSWLHASVQRRLRTLSAINMLVLLATVWMMVVKPTP